MDPRAGSESPGSGGTEERGGTGKVTLLGRAPGPDSPAEGSGGTNAVTPLDTAPQTSESPSTIDRCWSIGAPTKKSSLDGTKVSLSLVVLHAQP